jgi:large subunit ribosomal protein L23
MMEPREILRRPLLTEKGSAKLGEYNQYQFEVAAWANKIEIGRAVEALFKVKVLQVRTAIMPGKPARLGRFVGRRPSWKRATVTLKQGDKIEAFEQI